MATDVLTAEATPRPSPSAAGVSGATVAASIAGGGSISGAGQGSGVVMGSSLAESSIGDRPLADSVRAALRDYVQLTKPRIVVMILVTTTSTAMIGAGGLVDGVALMWLLLGTALVAASAGAANQVWERVIDQKMNRTAVRPLPAGRVGLRAAVAYTAALGIAGVLLLHAMFGPVPAAVGATTWLLYVLVYTPMKTRTSWNTTVGAIAGALPMLIGYTAMGGSLTDWSGWLLFGVLVAWQYPHFMAIAWMYRRQYAEAGFCMTTTVEPTGRSAGWQSVLGATSLILCGCVLCVIPGGWIRAALCSVAVIACVLPMLRASAGFLYEPSDAQARRLLRSSLLVLPGVLAIVTLRLFW